MDFLHPDKKRQHKIRLFVGYGLMSVALTIATLVVVFRTLGYDIDRNTGTVVQRSLMIIDAHPVAANIFIDGISRGQTSARFELNAGRHQVELSREGYRTWTNSFGLEGGVIEQVLYPFLFPQNLVTNPIITFNSSPEIISQSPDRRWLVVSLPNRPGTFKVFDLNDEDSVSTDITLPSDTLTSGSKHKFTAIEWANDNNHLLIKHTWEDGSEYIILNRGKPLDSLNITKLFPGQKVTDVALRDKKADQFYFYNKTTLTISAASVRNQSITPITRRVLEFKPYQNDTLLYVRQSTADKESAELRIRQDDKDYLLRNIPKSNKYLLDMAGFDGDLYVVGGSVADDKIYIFRNPLTNLSALPGQLPSAIRVLEVNNAQYLSFSAVSRFIALQGGSSFAIYDAETGRQYRYDTKLKLNKNQKAKWMDGHRLIAVSQNQSVVFDFDSTNKQILEKALPVFTPVFDRDFEAMFSLVKAAKKGQVQLTRTELRVDLEN